MFQHTVLLSSFIKIIPPALNNPNTGVTFYSYPSGTAPFTYLWNFSNGTTSTLASPTINLTSTSDPFSGPDSIETTSILSGDRLILVLE